MTRTTYYTASTLDGFLADEHDSLEWLFRQHIDEDGPMAYGPFIATIGALVMGATTYEWIRAHHLDQGEEWPYAVPTWVLTHRDLPGVDGADVRFASGDVRPVHHAMTEAAAGRDLWVVGGGDLAGQLVEAGLLDEVCVQLAPVTLGAGRPLLPRPVDLRLLEVARNGDFACGRYAVLGTSR
jgi:dihydrofolate reductase